MRRMRLLNRSSKKLRIQQAQGQCLFPESQLPFFLQPWLLIPHPKSTQCQTGRNTAREWEFQERALASVEEFKWSKPSSPQVFPSSSQSHFLTSGLISQASGTQPLDSTQCPPGSPLCTEMAFREVLLSPSL